MLGNVGQPLDVRRVGSEVARRAAVLVGDSQQVVMNRRAGFTIQATFLRMDRGDPLSRAQPPHTILAGLEPLLGQFVSDEPIPVTGVVAMGVQGCVDQMGVVPVPLAHRLGEPLVVPLATESPHTTRHRDRHPDRGAGRSHLTDEREDYFPGKLA